MASTEFSFEDDVYGTVVARPEPVVFNGVNGHFWVFLYKDPYTHTGYTRFAKTFMPAKSTRAQIMDQFQKMSCR